MLYVVKAIKDRDKENYNIEIAGIFDDEEKAFDAEERVRKYLYEEGFYDCLVYVARHELNCIECMSLYL